MKKILSLAVVAFMALGAQADDVKYLNFKTADGVEKSLPLEGGITITFNDGKIQAVAGEQTFTADLADMISMWFDVVPTAIDNILNDDLAEGTTVRVYGMDGRLVKTYQHATGVLADLPAGTYVISAGKKVAKVLVK